MNDFNNIELPLPYPGLPLVIQYYNTENSIENLERAMTRLQSRIAEIKKRKDEEIRE